MTHAFIPSHGIGEVFVNVTDTYWEMHNSSFNNLKKEIPFFKYLLELGSLTWELLFKNLIKKWTFIEKH